MPTIVTSVVPAQPTDPFVSVTATQVPRFCGPILHAQDITDTLNGFFPDTVTEVQAQPGLHYFILQPKQQQGVQKLHQRCFVVLDDDRNASQPSETVEQSLKEKALSCNSHCVLLHHAPTTRADRDPTYFRLQAMSARRVCIRIKDFAYTRLSLRIAVDIANVIETVDLDTVLSDNKLKQVGTELSLMHTRITKIWKSLLSPFRDPASMLSEANGIYKSAMQTIYNLVMPLPGAWSPSPLQSPARQSAPPFPLTPVVLQPATGGAAATTTGTQPVASLGNPPATIAVPTAVIIQENNITINVSRSPTPLSETRTDQLQSGPIAPTQSRSDQANAAAQVVDLMSQLIRARILTTHQERQISALRSEFENAKGQREQFSGQVAQLNQQLQSAQSTVVEARAQQERQISILRSELENANRQREQFSGQVAQLNQQLESARTTVAQLTNERDAALERVQRGRSELAEQVTRGISVARELEAAQTQLQIRGMSPDRSFCDVCSGGPFHTPNGVDQHKDESGHW